jgi:hypothetical protein
MVLLFTNSCAYNGAEVQMMKVLILSSLFLFSCSKKASVTYDINTKLESVQQIGETMAAIDESGGFINGDIAKLQNLPYQNSDVISSQSNWPELLNRIIPKAQADACAGNDYSTCSSNQKVRNLSGCSTSHGASIKGIITLTFSGTGAASCTIPANGDYVTRIPNIGINGVRGAVFGISSSGGQVLTRTGATAFTYADSGTRRRFIGPDGNSLLDLTISTSGTVALTGSSRAGRTLSGGSLLVRDALSSVSCEFIPAGVTWGAGCNCPTAGSFSTTCSDGSVLSISFSGTCGETTMSDNSVSSTVYMDRCE